MFILGCIALAMLILVEYADMDGHKRCDKINGHWISRDGGVHCVDNNFKEIEIYK
jgi:hypothetical protein